MPLDLRKVITQIKNLESNDPSSSRKSMLDATYSLFKLAIENQSKLKNKLIETKNNNGANFFFAYPCIDESKKETLDKVYEPHSNYFEPHIVVASDGSQIISSAHEITSASLINIGLISIPYFKSDIPVLLSSEPTIYSSLDELGATALSGGIQEEDLISYERTLKEIEELVNLAKKYSSYKLPILALLDGTMIHWHIEKFNDFFIKQFIERFSSAIYELKSLGIPVASYLSNSRSNDLINMLRVFKCPYESVDCKKYCSNLESKKLPCNPIVDYKSVLDRRLIENFFDNKKINPGARTIMFKSNNKVLNYYPDDLKVFFFYLHTGFEIARVELPNYVAKNTDMLSFLHNAIALQSKVGFGYPITLSEAHLQALISKNDRTAFYDLVKSEILQNKYPVKLSNKELKKRISFV